MFIDGRYSPPLALPFDSNLTTLRLAGVMHRRRTPLILLAGLLAVSLASAKKAQPALEWKTGFLWESPDGCDDTIPVWKQTFLILAEDNTLYHVAHTPIRHKPNVTERSMVLYALIQGDFYLQDDDGRVFKLAVVKKEQDPKAQELLKSGRQPCQP